MNHSHARNSSITDWIFERRCGFVHSPRNLYRLCKKEEQKKIPADVNFLYSFALTIKDAPKISLLSTEEALTRYAHSQTRE